MMQARTRALVAGIAVSAAVATLAGCSSSGGGTEKVTLTVQQNPNWSPLMDVLVPAFEKAHPGVTVKLQDVATDGNDQVVTGSNPPDIGILGWNGAAYAAAIDGKIIQSLDSVWKNQDLDKRYGENAKVLRSADGHAYSVTPYSGYYGFAWYNVDEFKKLGLPEPTDHRLTADQLSEIITKSKAAGKTPLSFGGQAAGIQAWLIDNVLPTAVDPKTLNEYKTGWKPTAKSTPDFEDGQFESAVQQIQNWTKAGLFQSGFLGQDLPTAESLWYQGQSLMTLGGSFTVSQLETNKVTFKADWLLLPSVKDDLPAYLQSYIGETLVVPTKSKHQDLAKDFLEMLVSDKMQEVVLTSGFNLPAVNTVDVSKLSDVPPLTASIVADAAAHGSAMGWAGSGVTPADVSATPYGAAIQTLLSGSGQASDVAKAVQKAYDDYRAANK